jgi:2',3'-cyclic-nucleotide 2'-phosphodiesterase
LIRAASNATAVRILFFGDLTGPRALAMLTRSLPQWRREEHVDAVIVNAENAVISRSDDPQRGFGMSAGSVDALLAAGVDVITGGNHSWDTADAAVALSRAQVIRPLNVGADLPGKGIVEIGTLSGTLAVVNLMGTSATGGRYQTGNPLGAFEALRLEHASVIVDFHSESVAEKQAFAHAVDGRAIAVLGTHTHEPSLLLHRLPRGTFFVADSGMVGPQGGVQGIAPGYYVRAMRGDPPGSFALAEGELFVGGLLIEVSEKGKYRIARFPRPR